MIVCIDPGHGQLPGRHDSGAVNRLTGARECDIALQWGMTIKHYLAQADIAVVMTRTDDDTPCSLTSRAVKAKAYGATHFISIHCNSSNNPFVSGTETFYRKPSKWASEVQRATLNALGLKDRGLKAEGLSQHSRLAVLDAPNPCLVELGFISCPKDLLRMQDRNRRIAWAKAIVKSLTGT